MMKSSWAFGGCECTELSDFRYYQCSVSLSRLYFTHLPLTALKKTLVADTRIEFFFGLLIQTSKISDMYQLGVSMEGKGFGIVASTFIKVWIL